MIVWDISKTRITFRRLFFDVKLVEACINDYDIFQRYLTVLEDGKKEKNNPFPSDIRERIIQGFVKMNWDGYND